MIMTNRKLCSIKYNNTYVLLNTFNLVQRTIYIQLYCNSLNLVDHITINIMNQFGNSTYSGILS